MADMTSSSSTPTHNPIVSSSTCTPFAGWDGGWIATYGSMDRNNLKTNMDRTKMKTLSALDLAGPSRVTFDGEVNPKQKQKTTQHQKNAIRNKLLGQG